MKRILILLLFAAFASYGQNSLPIGVLKSKADSTASYNAIPSGYGGLRYNTLRTPPVWQFTNDGGVTWKILGSGVSGSAGGDLSGTYPNPTVFRINGVSLSGLSTGILKNTTGTGAPSIAASSDFPTLNQNTTGSAGTLTTPRTIGIITGDAASSGSAFNGSANNTNVLTLNTVNSNVGSFGSATQAGTFTVNGKGLITAAGNTTITPAIGSITGLGTGVSTWLSTPSWTNFNSAITGTAPYWPLNGSGTQGSSGTTITQAVATSGSPTGFTYTGAAHTTLAAATEVTDWFLNLGRTINLNGGNYSVNRSGRFVAPTIGATSSTTINNAYAFEFVAPIAGTNVGFSTKGLSGGAFALSAVGGLSVSDPSFTGRGFFYQQANNATRIGGGPAGENITFGANNAITASNTMFGSGGFIASNIAGTNNNTFTSTYALAQTSGGLSPSMFKYSPSSAVSTSGTYSGTQYGFNYDDDVFAMTSTAGLTQVPFQAKARMIAAAGTTNYAGLLVNNVINTTGTHSGGVFSGVDVNPTLTSTTGTLLYGVRVFSNTLNSGFGTSTPTANVDINGTFRLRTGGTLDYVMKSDASGNATWQAPGSNFSASVKKFDVNVINIQTTSGNTDLALFTGLTDATIQVKINVVAIKSDGSEAYACEKTATFKKDGAATPVQVGITTTLSEHIDDLVENPFTGIAMNSTNIRFSYSAGSTSVDSYRWTIFAEVTQTTY